MRTRKNFQWLCMLVLISGVLACTTLSEGSANTATATAEIATTSIESTTFVKLTLITSNDGTADNPVFELFDNSGNILFATTLDKPGDLQPDQTDIYEFTVPHSFCQFIGWQLTKPQTSGMDDSWLPMSITIELDGQTVWLDGLFADLGSITADSQRGGNWSGIDIYIQQCGE